MKTLPSLLVLLSFAGLAARADTGPGADSPREFTVPPDRQQLIGVTFATAETRPLRRTIRAAGVVAATTAGQWDYVARVDGYVRDLQVAGPGDQVEKGQVLLDLYSPDLVATEDEYVALRRMRDEARRSQNDAAAANAGRMLAGARARLRQWAIADSQIDALDRSGPTSPELALESPLRGTVAEVLVHQGARVAAGDRLIRLVDLSTVWVWADFYEDELALLRVGQPVTVTGSALPGRSLAGRVAAIDPAVDEARRTGRVRIELPNPSGQLRPGGYVDVALALDEGEGLTVPVSAVLPTGEHDIVFVDGGGGRLEPRYVRLGGQYGDTCQVTAGLRAGERVVSSANFLIDAESKVQGALPSR